jgi:eukaryotic-like serine/threonine-protein kinase
MATDSPASLAPGTVIAERYRVVERLGEGGMGVVYSVEHTHMRKLFALKVLHRELLRMPEVVSRFEREAVLAGSINHANVAAATDFGKLPDGSFFLILELVVGKSLRALIAEGPVAVTRALPIMRGMTAGIAAAHAKGIVHRDLKPDNVMLVERDGFSDFVKVLDFGIAKGDAMPEVRSGGAQPLTQIGAVMGTPDYMSPEQALGQTVDHRSDLYSLGVIFYELITGAAPFHGDGVQVLTQHLTSEPAAIPAELVAGVAVPIASIVAKLLAKEPDARYQSAAELLGALDGVSPRASAVAETERTSGHFPAASPRGSLAAAREPGPVTAKSETTATTESEAPARGRLLVGLAALGVLLLTVVVMVILFSRREPLAEPEADASASAASSAVATDEQPPPPIASAAAEAPQASDDAPVPAASASTSVSAPSAAGRANRGRRTPKGRPAPRRTGPGGIYIPPPSQWFN